MLSKSTASRRQPTPCEIPRMWITRRQHQNPSRQCVIMRLRTSDHAREFPHRRVAEHSRLIASADNLQYPFSPTNKLAANTAAPPLFSLTRNVHERRPENTACPTAWPAKGTQSFPPACCRIRLSISSEAPVADRRKHFLNSLRDCPCQLCSG